MRRQSLILDGVNGLKHIPVIELLNHGVNMDIFGDLSLGVLIRNTNLKESTYIILIEKYSEHIFKFDDIYSIVISRKNSVVDIKLRELRSCVEVASHLRVEAIVIGCNAKDNYDGDRLFMPARKKCV